MADFSNSTALMTHEDPKQWRIVPTVYEEGEYAASISHVQKSDFVWDALGRSLDAHKPQGLGIMLSFAWQLHFYAYKEASARGIVTAVAMPTNVSALSGLMKSVPIEAVLTTEEGAHAFVQDLQEAGMLERIKVWFIVSPKERPSSFVAPVGTTVHDLLP